MAEINKVKLKKYLKTFTRNRTSHRQIDNQLDKLFGSTWFDSSFGEYMNNLVEMYLRMMADLCNIDIEELMWFVYEADCGDSPKDCKLVDGTLIEVDSIDTFLETV